MVKRSIVRCSTADHSDSLNKEGCYQDRDSSTTNFRPRGQSAGNDIQVNILNLVSSYKTIETYG